MPPDPEQSEPDFRDLDEKPPSLAREFVQFLGEHRKYWLLPLIAILLLLGILVILSGSSVAPFIYTLF